MKFDYIRQPYSLDPGQPYIPRPLIPVKLRAKAMRMETYALLDSGADRSVFHTRFAAELLLDLGTARKQTYYGIGEQGVVVYVHKINLGLVGSTTEIEAEVGFTDAPGVDAILGQADFFQHYQVKFERYKERMEINPAKIN